MQTKDNWVQIPYVKTIANNQAIIHAGSGRVIFQSYNSTIAEKNKGQVFLYAPYWNMYSATTNKYLLKFLGESSIKDVRAKAESGEYIVVDYPDLNTDKNQWFDWFGSSVNFQQAIQRYTS